MSDVHAHVELSRRAAHAVQRMSPADRTRIADAVLAAGMGGFDDLPAWAQEMIVAAEADATTE